MTFIYSFLFFVISPDALLRNNPNLPYNNCIINCTITRNTLELLVVQVDKK